MSSVPKIAIGLILTIIAPRADSSEQSDRRPVPVCIDNSGVDAAFSLALSMTSRMFAEIDVKIDWHFGLRACRVELPGIILISLSINTPQDLFPGALASAQPYSGGNVQVFYDRVREVGRPSMLPTLLAHVLVHEITHMLERSTHHSAQGIMKAVWDRQDLVKMAWKPLPFTGHDVELIHLALGEREKPLANQNESSASHRVR